MSQCYSSYPPFAPLKCGSKNRVPQTSFAVRAKPSWILPQYGDLHRTIPLKNSKCTKTTIGTHDQVLAVTYSTVQVSTYSVSPTGMQYLHKFAAPTMDGGIPCIRAFHSIIGWRFYPRESYPNWIIQNKPCKRFSTTSNMDRPQHNLSHVRISHLGGIILLAKKLQVT